MQGTTRYPALARRACSHQVLHNFNYRSTAEKSTQTYNLSGTLCAECCASLEQMVSSAGCDIPAVHLAGLLGTEKQVQYASSLRTRVYARLAPVISVAQSRQDPVAVALSQTFNLLFAIRSAKFWIEQRDAPYDLSWMQRQVAIIMRGRRREDLGKENSPLHVVSALYGEELCQSARSAVATAMAQIKVQARLLDQPASEEPLEPAAEAPTPSYEFVFDFDSCASR
jgi:hypothetical protein